MPHDQDTEKHQGTDAPDFLSRLWQWVFQRRTVQIALTYLAAGFAILEFLDIALRDAESADLIMSLARLFYFLGFLLIVFSAPLIFTGTHYFRTGLVAGIVAISLLAGILIRDQFETADRPVSVADPTVPVDNQSVEPVSNDLLPTGDGTGSTAGISPVINAETTDAGSATTTASSADGFTPEEEYSVIRDEVADGNLGLPDSETIDQQPETERQLSVVPDFQEPTTLERLLVIYGESDQVVLDTSARNQSLFAYSSSRIEIRFYSVSGGRRNLYVQPAGARRGERLEFSNIGAKASVSVPVQSGCGQLVYLVEATRISDNEAEVTGRIDRERSQANVQRAEALGQCQLI